MLWAPADRWLCGASRMLDIGVGVCGNGIGAAGGAGEGAGGVSSEGIGSIAATNGGAVALAFQKIVSPTHSALSSL